LNEQSSEHSPHSESTTAEALETFAFADPLESVTSDFDRIALIGVGVIGGSIGLRLKAMEYRGTVVGFDTPDVLREALERGAIDRGVGDISEAVAGADLIVLAVPVIEALGVLPTVIKQAKTGAVITDTCPTKWELERVALATAGAGYYIGGHPLAGKDRQGIANADPDLFENAYWLLCPRESVPAESRESLTWWVRMLGAYPLALDAHRHDVVASLTTHVPLILALTLSQWLSERSATEPLLSRLASGNFQAMTALAALPPEMWEGVLHSNREIVLSAVREFQRALAEIEIQLGSNSLADIWQGAAEFQRKLSRERPGDWDANCELAVTVPDRPGTLARIASILAHHAINIRDIGLTFVRERRGGNLRVIVETRSDARRALEVLKFEGFSARLK
jgi:prephenate dehydrogenase